MSNHDGCRMITAKETPPSFQRLLTVYNGAMFFIAGNLIAEAQERRTYAADGRERYEQSDARRHGTMAELIQRREVRPAPQRQRPSRIIRRQPCHTTVA